MPELGPGWSAVVGASGAGLAAWRGYLTAGGAVVAALLGGVILHFAGVAAGATAAAAFLVTSVLSRLRDRRELVPSHRANARRSSSQVLANGVVLALLAIAGSTAGSTAGPTGSTSLAFGASEAWRAGAVAAFLGCLGAVAGDTWASAIAGRGASRPRLVTTGRRVRPGTPGAVTAEGIALGSAAGAFCAACFLLARAGLARLGGLAEPRGFERASASGLSLVVAATAGALCGSLADSFLGAAVQANYVDRHGRWTDEPFDGDGVPNTWVRGRRWLTNDLVNFAGSAVGALTGCLAWSAARAFAS